MKTLAKVGACLVIALAASSCSRNNIEAVNLAIEADKVKGSNIDEAISKYEQATNMDPNNHRIWWKLALAYHKKEQWDKVANACSRAEKIAPTFANYFMEHGVALARQAQKGPTSWADCKEPLNQALKLDANLADAHFELAEAMLHLDDEAGALQAYSKAVEVRPDEHAFYGPYADQLLRLGFIDQAEQILKESLNYPPKDGEQKRLFVVHSLLGAVAELRGNLTGAVTSYEAAKKSCGQCAEPGQPIAYFNLGVAYANLNPPEKSKAVQNLQAFQKVICKGAAAQRYADQCATAQAVATKMGGTLQ
jgi:tetratricopeptide (TPR) repeat protein